MKKNTLIDIACALLAFLFMYAAVSKLLDITTFRLQLSQSPFITRSSEVVALALPVFEICVALMLAFPSSRLTGLYTALFLLTLFTSYLMAMLHFSYYIPCSCGGILSSLSWNGHIVLNSAFIALAFVAIHISETKRMHAEKNSKTSL